MGYGCANPDWGAKTDKNYEIERRQRWPQSGHSKVTMEFYDEVFKAPNLLAILAGHTHRLAMDVKDGISQIVAGANAYGNYLDVKVQSML
jgi:2',3'-cyclic-nucleotide 2'-phosphodiesterase (5'-nucleotidase family)